MNHLPTRDGALALVRECTPNDRLVKHMLAVEACMRHYARQFGEDEEFWGLAGLLHDFDYEKFPDEHPVKGSGILREKGYPEDLIQTILSHYTDRTGVERVTRAQHCLFACDELTGFIIACSLVKPNKSLSEVDVESVKRKMKDKAFARAVNRDDFSRGADALGLTLDQHIQNCTTALQSIHTDLGL
ncbi:MAG: HD domain-containing protein [bacterium]